MKSLKIGLIIGFFTLVMLGGLYVSASCSATATRPGCSSTTCSITAPPGGSSICTSEPNKAKCQAFDTNGNLCNSRTCHCLTGGGSICAIMFNPTC